VLVRPARISDEDALRDLFYRMSDESTFRRFLTHKRAQPHDEMLELVNLNYEHNMALIVSRVVNDNEDIIGMGRYDVDPATLMGDIALVVRDEQHNHGIGTVLMRRMAEIGKARGLAGFSANVVVQNKAMMAIIQKSGYTVHTDLQDGVYHVELCF
jgi:GNAT superfamily N-acetyltransferase